MDSLAWRWRRWMMIGAGALLALLAASPASACACIDRVIEVPAPPVEPLLLAGVLAPLGAGLLMRRRQAKSAGSRQAIIPVVNWGIALTLASYYLVYRIALLQGASDPLDAQFTIFSWFLTWSVLAQLGLSQWLLLRLERTCAAALHDAASFQGCLITPICTLLSGVAVIAMVRLLSDPGIPISAPQYYMRGFSLSEHASLLSWWVLSIALVIVTIWWYSRRAIAPAAPTH